jgi:hypothetical protein
VENSVTRISTLEDQEQEYREMYNKFNTERKEFSESIHMKALPDTWQKNYFRGLYPDGTKCPADHQTKLKLNKFE